MSDPASSATATITSTLRRNNYLGLGAYLDPTDALLAMVALFSILSSRFPSYGAFLAIANRVLDLMVPVVSMTFILVVGDTNLSTDSMLALAALAISLATLGQGWGILPAAMLGMACAALAGCVTGSVAVAQQIPSFIVSLGVLEIARGLAYRMAGSRTVYIDDAHAWPSNPLVFGISPAFVIALLVMFVVQAALTRTVFGHYLTDIGTSKEAVRLTGVNPKPYKIVIFALMGLPAGLAALFRISRLEAADPSTGVGPEPQVITTVVIGGISLVDGRGSVISTFFSMPVISALAAGLVQIGASEPTRRITTRTVIVVAVMLGTYRGHHARRQGWMMATMKDVAAMAGISFTTASHVVNRTRPVSNTVRKRVRGTITQLHYVSSAVVYSLKVRTTPIIGLLVSNSVNPYFVELSRGIKDYCEHSGYCVILCNSDDNPREQANYLRVLQEKRIDGLALAFTDGDGALVKGLTNIYTPAVIVDREVEDVEAGRVQVDHGMGTYLATHHLLELGHHGITYIGGPLSAKVSTLRVEGYRQAMTRAGLEVRPQRLLRSEFSNPGDYHVALSLLDDGGERSMTVIAGDNMIGTGMLHAATELDVGAPHELSVIGLNDTELSRLVFPALATVDQSVRLLGETAAQLLPQRIAEREEPMQRRVVAPALALCESTVSPLARA